MSYELDEILEDMQYDDNGKLVCDDTNINDYFNLYYENPTNFRDPMNEWNVSAVTNMEYLFLGAAEFNEPLNNWDVRNLVHMKGMFKNAMAFDQDISNWDLTNVNLDNTIVPQIFLNCPIRNEHKPRIFQLPNVPIASDMPAAEEEYMPDLLPQEGGYRKKSRTRRRKSKSKRKSKRRRKSSSRSKSIKSK